MKMKKTYLAIIEQLRYNARMTLTKMSKSLGIPISTIFDKIKDFQNTCIMRYTTIVDFRKLGYEVKVSFIIKVDKNTKDALCSYLIQCGFVNNLFKINHGYDFLLEAIFRNIQELDHFEKQIDDFGIIEMQRHFILEDIARESFMTGLH